MEHDGPQRRRRIVIATFGSLGDLHPYLALGLGLQARGHDVALATGACYRRKVEALSLGFHAVRPDCAWVNDPETMARIAHPRWGITRAVGMLMDGLRDSYSDMLAAVAGADLLVTNMAAYAGRLAAEKAGVAWVSVMHLPTGLFSAYDPPLIPGFPEFSRRLRFLGPRFWGPFGRSVNWAMRWLGRPWHELRREVGLPPVRGINPLTESHSTALHLALFSKLLVDKQRDWPASTLVTGFPWFDTGAELPAELARFLDAGSPPIVFTLGSAIASVAGRFYEESAAAAQLLRRRAVLILGAARNRPRSLPEGVIACDYAPYMQVFPRATAIVHHGGIGTTGLALRSGRPMLVMPCAWDQPDNAERAVRLGVARTIAPHHFSAARAAAELRRLLDDAAYSRGAAAVGAQVQQENGVRVACAALDAITSASSTSNRGS
jgi:rhamnosyltransferase subunit B